MLWSTVDGKASHRSASLRGNQRQLEFDGNLHPMSRRDSPLDEGGLMFSFEKAAYSLEVRK